MNINQILKKYWGFSAFRPLQEDIINSILSDNDTFALLPTGGGKSICFQVPAMMKEGACIVISPLIALIEDQVKALKDKGIKAVQIKSGTSEDEIITLFDNIRFGNYKFLYLSPERLQSEFIQQKITQLNVSMVAIDEAHCISEWGHDFRPSYRNISVLREIKPKAKFIALTATATKKVVDDIVKSLQLHQPKIFKKSFYRDNLTYQIIHSDDKLSKLNQIFTKIKEPSIIYVNSRKKTHELANYLNANNFSASFYNGGMSAEEKKASYDNWFSEKTPIMVATNAFGMGIDKPNVRVVIHYNLPYSVENYIQEAGRGGRDGKKAFSIILTNKTDLEYTKEIQERMYPNLQEIKEVHKKLYQYFSIAKGELITNEFDFILIDFCDKYGFNAVKTFNTLQILSSFGIIEFNPNSRLKSRIQFLVNSNRVLQFSELNLQLENFIKTILRLYTGVFEKEVTIDEFFVAKKAGITSNQVFKYLKMLENQGVISYHKSCKNASILFLQPREDDKTINLFSQEIKSYLKHKKLKINDLIHFIENDLICRNIQILNYFDEKSNQKCNSCDVCRKTNTSKDLKNDILQLIRSKNGISSHEICTELDATEKEILVFLRFLLSEEIIKFKNNTYYI